MSRPILAIKGVSKRFGGVQALSGVDLVGLEGQVHGVIGPNGAGKSTLIGCITGVNRIDEGEIRFRDRRIDGLSVQRRARLGVARTFQKIRLAQELTVFENVAVGLASRRFNGVRGFLSALRPLDSADIRAPIEEALQAAGVADIATEKVGSLPYGRRHFVELARVLVGRPEMLLLDEPATGLTEAERERLMSLVRRVVSEGALVVLVEHDLNLVGRLCDRVTVIDYGRRIFNGTPAEAQQDDAVVKAYLGTSKLAQAEAPRVATA